MTTLFNSETRLEAWVMATDAILDKDDYNMRDIILHIDSPEKEHRLGEDTYGALNEMYAKAGKKPIHTIAEWIFPGALYKREGIKGVYETYPVQREAFKSIIQWGPYALRLVKRIDPETGEHYNPLKTLIDKMARANKEGNPEYHSCYEMGFLEGPFDIPLYDPAKDRKRPYGGQCLSHLSFKLFDGIVHLTAFYRSHEYRFKVPGNLLGLARLQECVANEVGAEMGDLVVHSSRAFIDKAGGKPAFESYVRDLIAEVD